MVMMNEERYFLRGERKICNNIIRDHFFGEKIMRTMNFQPRANIQIA